MMGVELLGAPRQLQAALPVARKGQQLAERSDGIAVHGVECDGPLRRMTEALEFLLEEEHLGQAEQSQMIGWRYLDGAPRRGCPPRQGIRLKIESLPVILGAQ